MIKLKNCLDREKRNFRRDLYGLPIFWRKKKKLKKYFYCYVNRIKEHFIPLVEQDIRGSVSVKIVGCVMKEEDVNVLKGFIDMVKRTDFKSYLLDLVEACNQGVLEIEEDNKSRLNELFERYHGFIGRLINDAVKEEIFNGVKNNVRSWSEKHVGVYNFTASELDSRVTEVLRMGANSVPTMSLSFREVERIVDMALISYFNKHLRKKIGKAVVADSVECWLRQVMTMAMDDESKNCFKKALEECGSLRGELRLVYNRLNAFDVLNESELMRRIEQDGNIAVMCDKAMGISVFGLKTMKEADKSLMCQLGALPIEFNSGEVIEKVLTNIADFEDCLDEEQLSYLNTVYPLRDVRSCNIQIPFLRSTHKVHKMTDEALLNRETSNLKFRPVVDARMWCTRGYSELVMKMLRKMNQQVLERSGHILRGVNVKNGWQFVTELKEKHFDRRFNVFISADIQEAYTNITEDMICNSIRLLNKIVGWYIWKEDLLIKMVSMILGNNYVETSVGIYLFGRILPMGYKLSKEALDSVAISGEVYKLHRVGEEDAVLGRPISELYEYPEELVDISVRREVAMSRGVNYYRRYVDDSFAMVGGDTIEEIVDGILCIGYMFGGGLTVNVDMNIWCSKFLDVLLWRDVDGATCRTMLSRKVGAPFGHVRKDSDHPIMYKLQSMLGEMLRNRRLGSDMEIVKVVDDSILEGFMSIGYSRVEVLENMVNCKKLIREGYSNMYVKLDKGVTEREISFGGVVEYNGLYNFDYVVKRYLASNDVFKRSVILSVPGRKLKNIVFTRKRYLKRQRLN